jgi:hypothetical protein
MYALDETLVRSKEADSWEAGEVLSNKLYVISKEASGESEKAAGK